MQRAPTTMAMTRSWSWPHAINDVGVYQRLEEWFPELHGAEPLKQVTTRCNFRLELEPLAASTEQVSIKSALESPWSVGLQEASAFVELTRREEILQVQLPLPIQLHRLLPPSDVNRSCEPTMLITSSRLSRRTCRQPASSSMTNGSQSLIVQNVSWAPLVNICSFGDRMIKQ